MTSLYPNMARRALLPDQVRQAIEELILRGLLQEGDQIVEYQVAKEMGISQTPVREALRTLAHEGLVVTIPHRGTFVRHITRREASERYSLGAELEAFAIRLALPQLTEADFEHLDDVVNEMVEAARQWAKDDSDSARARTVELNVAFHRYLVERANHELLLRAWLFTNPLNWRFVTYTRVRDTNPVERAERHRDLLELCRTRDADRCSNALRKHIEEAAAEVLPSIAEEAPTTTYAAARESGTGQ